MRLGTVSLLVMSSIIGVMGAYQFVAPFMKSTTLRVSPITIESTSIVILRGTVESIDRDTGTITMHLKFPGYPEASAPFRIPFDHVQNFMNLDLHKGQANEIVRDGRDNILTLQVGQLVTLRLLRRPGPFTALSLSASSPEKN